MISVADWVCFLGFDYHDCFVQVCVIDQDGNVLGNRRIDNRISEIVNYVDDVRGGRLVKGAAVESCCGSSRFAEELIDDCEWEVRLAHAGVCAKMKQNPDKTDFGDAQLLADLCRVGYLPGVWLPPSEIRDLRRLGRYRQQLVNQRRDVKLRIRALLREERIEIPEEVGNPWTKGWLEWVRDRVVLAEHSRWVLDEHLSNLDRLVVMVREIEKRMELATSSDKIVQQLRSCKGVGLVTAVVMRSEIGSFDRFASGKQLSRYCAVTPKNASSGKRQADAGLVKAGSLALRTMIIEAAHRLTRYQQEWKEMKQRLVERGKPASVAVAAVANRWVRRLYWEMKNVDMRQVAA